MRLVRSAWRVSLALGLGVLAASCSLDGEVGGLWQSSKVSPVSVEALAPGFSGMLALSAAQFGKDVSGTLFLFTDGFSKVSAYPDCPCLYMDSAEFSGGDLTFRAQRCDGQWVLGRLTLGEEGEDEVLEGTLTDEDGKISEVLLVRTGDDETVQDEEWNRGCSALATVERR